MDKGTLRAEMKATLAGIKPLSRSQQEELVNAAIISHEDWQAADTVLAYKAVRTELSVTSAVNAAWRAGKRVLFPRIAPGGALVLHEVKSWDALSPGAFGIPEPAADAPLVTPMEVDLALVPGIAFTADGKRLGQGGGFYDRLIPMLGGISWGVGFDEQLVEDIPTEAHDRPVDRVVHAATLTA